MREPSRTHLQRRFPRFQSPGCGRRLTERPIPPVSTDQQGLCIFRDAHFIVPQSGYERFDRCPSHSHGSLVDAGIFGVMGVIPAQHHHHQFFRLARIPGLQLFEVPHAPCHHRRRTMLLEPFSALGISIGQKDGNTMSGCDSLLVEIKSGAEVIIHALVTGAGQQESYLSMPFSP